MEKGRGGPFLEHLPLTLEDFLVVVWRERERERNRRVFEDVELSFPWL